MRIRVLLFAQVRMAADQSSLDLELPEGTKVADALRTLEEKLPAISPHLSSCRAAVGVDYAHADQTLVEGDELSLIPPVQGG